MIDTSDNISHSSHARRIDCKSETRYTAKETHKSEDEAGQMHLGVQPIAIVFVLLVCVRK